MDRRCGLLSRRNFLHGACGVAGVTLLAACSAGPSQNPTAAPAAPVTTATQVSAAQSIQLKIGGWYDAGTQKVVQQQISLFQKKYPNVSVAVVVITGTLAKDVVLIASGASPDVFWVNNDQTAPWASRNALRPLDSYIKTDQVDMNDQFDVGKVLYSYKGVTYALPESLAPLLIFYNPKAFEAAGVKPPPSDHNDKSWTLDALIEKAKALTKQSGSGPAQQYGFFVSTSLLRWYPFLWDFGGDIVDNTEAPTKIIFDSEQSRQALQWVVDLWLKNKVTPTIAESQSLPWQPGFETGRIVMLDEGPWMWPSFQAPTVRSKVPWEMAAMPYGPAGAFTRMAGNGDGLSVQSKNPDMAWKLLEFNTVGDGQSLEWTQLYSNGIPGKKSFANDPRWASWFSPSSKQTLVQLPDYARTSPKHPNWAEVQTVLASALDQMWTGQISVDQAVKDAQVKMEQALTKGSS